MNINGIDVSLAKYDAEIEIKTLDCDLSNLMSPNKSTHSLKSSKTVVVQVIDSTRMILFTRFE